MHVILSSVNNLLTISQVYSHRNNSKSLIHYWIILVYEPHHEKTEISPLQKQIVQSSSFLNLDFQANSRLPLLYMPVCISPGWKHSRLVFPFINAHIEIVTVKITYYLLCLKFSHNILPNLYIENFTMFVCLSYNPISITISLTVSGNKYLVLISFTTKSQSQ